MNVSECVQGRRVRLTVDLEGGQYKAGDTGYLNRVLLDNEIDGRWGVVFDRDADNDMRTTNFQLEASDGKRVWVTHVVEPIEPGEGDDTKEITPLDLEFIGAEHEMELIRRLASAQDAINRVKQGPMTEIGVDGFLDLCDARDGAIDALIKYCRGRWLSDPVYAPIGGD